MLKRPYESYLAVCPYYNREDALHVFCVGWADDIDITVTFQNAKQALAFKEKCCRSLRGCTDCPVHQMLAFELAGEEEDIKKAP